MADFNEANEIYANFFKNCQHLPARVCYQVAALPLNANIEIEAMAYRG